MTQSEVVQHFVAVLQLEPEFYGEITVRVEKGHPVKWRISQDRRVTKEERAV